jgi:beta-lactamase class A
MPSPRAVGLATTVIVSDLQGQLDQIADAAGFSSYRALAAHDGVSPPASQIESAIVGSPALDPRHGTRTTAIETVELLKAIWTDRAGPPEACAEIRDAMARQLVRARIASGFDSQAKVAAKSGGLMGVVRNEAGVVTLPDGQAYAVAVFTRCPHETRVEPAEVDVAIGVIARALIDELRRTLKSRG